MAVVMIVSGRGCGCVLYLTIRILVPSPFNVNRNYAILAFAGFHLPLDSPGRV